MKKRHFATIFAGALAVAAAMIWWRSPRSPLPSEPEASLPQTCRDVDFESVGYVVCEIDLAAYEVTLARLDAQGRPYGSVKAFTRAVTALGEPVLLAMNAGMYHKDLSPVGLFVENGRQEAPLNLADGFGNFFLKPNGVFFVARNGRAGVLESGAFAAENPDVAYATQSGPMLVIDGKLHPRFLEDGTSRYIRNGVGVRADGTVVLAVSRTVVSLGSFGRLFRDALGCPNALFFDGAVSTFSNGSRVIVGGDYPAGPILAVRAKG
ncbi:phosphodiester glycosidase family protein [Mesorhizobium sp. PUT5]|uniref:phosphodiester glycosidase family protein n=1 Tax=Mesorhizobium sp. PUT5 TaxID=3454629 RepID=UPI003FA46B19